MKPFGAEHNEAMARLEAEVRAEGGRTETEVFFEAIRRRGKELDGKPLYRERQEHWLFAQRMRSDKERRAIVLIPTDLDYLIAKLAGVNDPQGVVIREKLERMRRR